MDPQKKIWRKEPGQKYMLTENKPINRDSFAPYKFSDACSLGLKQNYPGTMIRLPLRNKASGLSRMLYNIEKLKSILSALKDDANILLLFLRYIEKVEVFVINDRDEVDKIFCVKINAIETIRTLKNDFLTQVKEYYAVTTKQSPHLQYEVTIVIQDFELRSQKDCQWDIMQWVGSKNENVLCISKKVCSLPWVGVAISHSSQLSSRMFCFLPMADSEELNPPLPICVHGTFGLTKDRCHLKWKTSERRNDYEAKWNELLLSEMLPACIYYCLRVFKNKCGQDKFYTYWPDISVVSKTNWKVILKPLLLLLLQDQLFWSQNGSWVKLRSSVYVVPQMNSDQFPQVVINALIRCGKVVVVLDDRVWEAVKFIYANAYPFTTITPSLVRKVLRNNSAGYTNMSRTERFKLLHYCIEDEDYHDLPGLILLPLVNKALIQFEYEWAKNPVYICDREFLDTKLLANNEAALVNVEEEDSSLHHKLIEIANSNYTQLQHLTTESFGIMLKKLLPFQNGWCCYGAAGGFYNAKWLEMFWKWVRNHQLSHFIDIPLVPICNRKNSRGFSVVALQSKSNSKVIKYNTINPKLIDPVIKLGCSLTCSHEFKFLHHINLSDYVHDFTPSSVLSVSSQMMCQNITFTQEEAKALRYFVFQYSPVSFNNQQKSVLLKLCIFPSLQSKSLHSLQYANSTIAGKAGAMIVLEPECLNQYKFCIPCSPLLLTCDTSIVRNLQVMLPQCTWRPTKLEIILHIILQNKQLTKENLVKLASVIVESREYYNLLTQPESKLLTDTLRSLKFLPTCKNFNNLVSPCEVYDPKDRIIKELFKGQNVFPVAPFKENYFGVLKELGMKTSDDLDMHDICKIIQLICNPVNTEVETARAHKLLEYLSSSKGNSILITNQNLLSKAHTTSPWLPVIVTPPKDYPEHLCWKGATGSHFVSAQHIHASSIKDDHQKLPYLIGSQMKLLQYNGTLTLNLINSLGISQITPINAMVQQLFKLVALNKVIKRDKFDYCIGLLYDHLQSEIINANIGDQLLQSLSQSKIVQVSEHLFVQPSLVTCSFDDKTMTLGKLEPYLYILPNHLQQYRTLFCEIGARKQISIHDVLAVLKNVAFNQNINDLSLTINILSWLCNNFTSSELKQLRDKIFVPIDGEDTNSKLVLKSGDQVAFLDKNLQWLKRNKGTINAIMEGYHLVHPLISNEMVCTLQLKRLNTMIANTKVLCFEQAGQSEPLTTRLNRILKEYKDTSVIQELLQNADDAGATEVSVYYDTREHDSSNLFFPGMANSYGPALLFYNNAEFTEEDFENIRKISGETKVKKSSKIGKFGVGFCSVYHITDVPSFISGEYFVVFDPTLQCLKEEIENKFNPGIKLNYCADCFLKTSDQFVPYSGIHGFDHKKPFKGTLFRFPLRSRSSEISKTTWNEEMLLSIINTMKKNAPKLLMFLNNVKKISFHQSHDNGFRKVFSITATKTSLPNVSGSNLTSYKVFSPQFSECKEENWIIATNSQQLDCMQYGTASVSVKLKTDAKTQLHCIDPVEGECFCYLPLQIETGLNVHVSSNFAVTTNRRGLWKGDNAESEMESNWNKSLMKSVVFQAYVALLLHLKQMKEDRVLVNYEFCSLWPVKLKETVPWEVLLNKFYNSILSSEFPLFYSKIGSWKCLNECKFLLCDILSASFENELQLAIHKVADILKLPVVDLPDVIWNRLGSNGKFKSCVINEEQFLELFYEEKTFSIVPIKYKSIIVKASLLVYANKQHSARLPELMQSTKCIPCCPEGKHFNKPQNIVDSKSPIAVLFNSNEHMCPDDAFLMQSSLLHQSLVDLGMMQSLPWKLIVDRAKNLQRILAQHCEERVSCLSVLVSCIKENLSKKSIDMPSVEDRKMLQKASFLPVMQKPTDYLMNWKGDSVLFSCGPQLTKHTDSLGAINAINACGSQIFILDTNIISPKLLTKEVLDFLGIRKELETSDVANQFTALLEWFQSIPVKKRDHDIYQFTNSVISQVYNYWGKNIASKHLSVEFLSYFLANKHCIWNGTEFLHPSTVSFKWPTDGPFLHKPPVQIPSSMQPVMKYLGIEDEFSVDTLVTTLCKMKQMYGKTPLPFDSQEIVNLILPKITNNVPDSAEMFLPDDKFVLRRVNKLKYNDAPWCTLKENYLYCHNTVSRETALSLGVELVRSILLQDFEITEDDLSEDFGQEEKLTQRLNNILRDYPKDVTFIKEILQNADDAGARRLYFFLDKRYHSNKEVISETWKKLQGPALLIWNDSTFSKDDFDGIQRLGLGSKIDDANKIGHYGIGFSVVYHFTDCPSFVTDNMLCVLDPHYHYIAHKKLKPGKKFKNFDKLYKKFPSMKSPYLLNDQGSVSQEIKNKGTLFRLPLRLTQEMAEISDFTNDTISLEQFELNLREWISQVSEALLFLRHISDVKFFVIGEGKSRFDLHIKVKSVITAEKAIIKEVGSSKLLLYPMTLFSNENKKTEWLVQLGEGNVEDPDFNWDENRPLNTNIHPHHGIAVPVHVDDFEAKSFCFLPLPGETHLPIHVHGQFILHSDRRGHWVSSSVKSKAKKMKPDGDVCTTTSDPKAVWNELLLKAVSVSYAHFLVSYRKTSPGKKEMLQKTLDKFYNLFPILNKYNEPWLTFAKQLYETLYDINAPILAKLQKHDAFGMRNEKETFMIKWYELNQPNSPDECFFNCITSNLYNALTSIGMNLINTPNRIREQFLKVDKDLELCEVSKKSVLKYYSQFYNLIYNHNPLPCPLSLTKFKGFDYFTVILNYVMQNDCRWVIVDEEYVLESTIKKDFSMLGLVVTADENLHPLSDSKDIISSVFWNLFPNSSQNFIHNSLLEYYLFNSDYLFFNGCNRKEKLKCILSVIGKNLPSSWNLTTQASFDGIKSKWIKKLFDCLVNDPVFCDYYDEILTRFPLLPASNDKVYSASSKILPFKTEIIGKPKDNIEYVKKLLMKLKVPLFRHDILSEFKETITVQLPSVLNAEKILESLYLNYLNRNLNMLTFQILSENELKLLFEIFKRISYSSSTCQNYIKNLPIFTTMDNKLVSLDGMLKVWIWDDQTVCTAGIDKWLNSASSYTVFLSPSAPWACLKHEAENLQISNIDKYDVYCTLIFPNFSLLDRCEQLCQLRYIKDYIYPECKYYLEKYRIHKDVIKRVETFVEHFKSLECIVDGTGNLHTIDFFYDHNEILFELFCQETVFLPSELRNTEWLEFLQYFGLKYIPTKPEFISFCRKLPELVDISAIANASSALLKALFYIPPLNVHENKYREIHSFSCLQEVSQIPIAIVQDVPELNSIKAQKLGDHVVNHGNSTFSLTKLSGSSLVENKYLVWTVKPLTNLDYNRDSPVCLNRLKYLGVILTPSIEDVILNLKNLSTTAFASYSIKNLTFVDSIANSYLLPEVVVAMLKHIQSEILNNEDLSFEEACNNLQHHNLSNTNILPVRVLNTEHYALAVPTQVLNIKSSDIDCYYPFLHSLIEKANGVVHFLSNIGVQNTLNFSHIQSILQLAKMRFQDNQVDSTTLPMIIKATQDLVKLLQHAQSEDDIVQNLQPLYLLSDDRVLTECSRLVVHDISGSCNVFLPFGYAYLHPLEELHLENALLHFLPKQLGLISLKSIMRYEMVDNKPAENAIPCVSIIEEILKSNEFTKALLSFSNCCTHGTTPDCVTDTVTNFQNNLTVRYLNTVDVQTYLAIDGDVIEVNNTFRYSFFLEKITDQQWTLNLKNTPNAYSLPVCLQLAKQICSKLKLKFTGYFDVTDNDDLPDLATFVGLVLQCDSVSSITSVIKEYLPGAQSKAITSDDALSDFTHDEHLLELLLPEEWISDVNEPGKENISYKQMLQKVTSTFLEWKESKPEINLNEAKIWIQQAQYDQSTLSTLMNASKTDGKNHFAAICFMCHQVAEKALKAGMYAKCGMEQFSLHTHNLMHFADELKKMGVSKIHDHEVNILNSLYVPTRYPNCHNPSAVPGDKFSTNEAERAFDIATRILVAMQEMIDDICS